MPEGILNQDIIKELGIENLPEEKKIALIEKMTDLIQKKIAIRVMEEMAESDKPEFEKLLQANDQQAVNKFLTEKISNMPEIVQHEIIAVKKELINQFSKSGE